MDPVKFADLAEALAWQLGELRHEKWAVGEQGVNHTHAVLCGPGKARLSLGWNAREGKLRVSGLGPDGRAFKRWSVNVDPQRGLLAIGRDIDRRLISAGYADDLVVALAKKAERDAEYSRRQKRQITRHALHRLAMSGDDVTSQETRDIARAALADMDGQDRQQPRDILARFPVQPGLDAVVEDSTNVLLELRTFNGTELIGRTGPLNRADVARAMELAWIYAEAARADAESLRLAHLAARQRGDSSV